MTKKQIPQLNTDQEAAGFVETADLSEYDLQSFTPTSFEFANKDTSMSLRLSQGLHQSLKQAAQKQGIPTQKFIRQALERALS